MPTPHDLDGFILKKEACSAYNRSFRQLGRDLDKAFAKNDESFLDNFRLRLEDGTVLVATEVSKEQIQKLRDKGLNPTWFVREKWMKLQYGLRGDSNSIAAETPKQSKSGAADDITPKHEAATQPVNAESLIQSKDEIISLLREENGFLRESLSHEREQGAEHRQLTRDLHILMKNLQDRLLPSPDAGRSLVAVEATPKPPTQQVVHTTTTKDAETKAPHKKTVTRKKSPKRPVKKSASPEKKTTDKKPKWYEMPTLKGFFSK